VKLFFRTIIFLILSTGLLCAQHLKKDGSPDRRFKENRTIYSSHSKTTGSYPTHTNIHLKKDGTPDMRYKENKTIYTQPTNRTHKLSSNKIYHDRYPVARDNHGRIKRSESAKRAFMKQSGFPHGRPGYVVDHIIPLKKGGCDCPSNMQWQTIEEAKAKDKWE
jgi:hypothetical protein